MARNRARRRLRAAAEIVLGERAERGRDYVLIGRRQTVSRPFAALVGDLEKALARTGAALTDAGAPRRRERERA